MSNPEWGKRKTDEPIWEGPRVVEHEDLFAIDDLDKMNLEIIFEAMEYKNLIVFEYKESSRVVAPFVLGISSEGNPLLRGYQLEGVSRSGKGAGWRVFQVKEMQMVEKDWDFFVPEEFDFDRSYPWTHKVLKMI